MGGVLGRINEQEMQVLNFGCARELGYDRF
jgi:hypothetical protein